MEKLNIRTKGNGNMKAQDLKNSILQLAIQGKLVPQDSNDESAEVLYTQIQSEKQKLLKEGKIKKDKPLPPITDDEIPFPIPSTWKWVKLGDIIKIYTGSKDANYGSENGIYPFFTCAAEPIKCDYFSFDGESLLLPGNGANVGLCIYYDGKFEAYQRTYVLQGFVPYLKYLHHLLNFRWKKYNEDKMYGSAMPYIKLANIQNFPVPLPPLSEQKRIVAKIEELEPLVKQYDKAETELSVLNGSFPEQLKKSILQYAIQGKLIPQDVNDEPAEVLYAKIQDEKQKLIKEGKIKKDKPLPPITDDEIPFPIPSTWKWVRLGDIVYNHGQKQPKTKFTYIDIGSIDNKHYQLSENEQTLSADKAPSRARKIVKYGDIVYSTVRPYLHNTAIINKNFTYEPIASTGFAVLAPYDGIYNEFLFKYLLSPAFDNYANNTDNSKGVAYPAINDDKFYKALIPLPPLAEQKRIVAKINELMQYCDTLIQLKNN